MIKRSIFGMAKQGLILLGLLTTLSVVAVNIKADVSRRPLLAIGRTATVPVIDGDLNEAAWSAAASVPVFCDFQSGRVSRANTQVLVAWNDDCLFVGFRCEERQMADLRAALRDRDSGLWGEDSVEVFLRPQGAGYYFHFIMNPLGTLYDAKVQNASWNSAARGAARKGRSQWTCELAIPWRDVGGPPAIKSAWTGNFTRNRRTSGEELSCWSVTGGSFHNPEAFGQLLFIRAAPSLRAVSLGNMLPGVNLFRADVTIPPKAAQPVTLTLKAFDASRPLLRATVIGAAGLRYVKKYYQLLPDDVRAPLQITLEASGLPLYRQRIALDVAAAPSIARLRAADLETETFGRFAPPPARRQGERLLKELDSALEAARRKQTSLTRGKWEEFVKSLAATEGEVMRPIVWTAEPTSTVKPETLPPSLANAPTLDIALAQNERESIALRLRNVFFPRCLDVRMSVTDLKSVSPAPSSQSSFLARERITLMEAIPVPSRAGGVIVDPLSPLGSSGIVHLEPDKTHEIWVTVDSENVAPGYFLGALTLEPLDPRTEVGTTTLPLRVRIWPIELPKQMPIHVFVCDYGRSGKSTAFLQDLILHHTNVFNVNALPDPDGEGRADFSGVGKSLELVRGKGLIFVEVWFMRATGWKPQYERWVRDAANAMEALGIPFKDWVLHIYDETLCDEFLECAKRIKAIEPRLQIFSDYMGTPEQIKAFAPYIDFWCPHSAALTNTASLEAMRATGKPIWTYECGSVKDLPVGRYRALPWRAWRYKLDGVFFWCYPGSAWNELPIHDLNYGHTYEGYRGEPVSSKRWEAWSDGLEDYLLLRAYETKLEEQKTQTTEDKTLLAQAQAIGDANGGDPAEMTDLRRRIAHRLLELQGTPVRKDFPNLAFPLWPLFAVRDGQGTASLEPGGRTNPDDLAMVVRSPTEKSWTFLIQTLDAHRGDQIRFSLWARGRGLLRVGVSEGFHFGGDPTGHRITDRYIPLREDWQEVHVEHEVKETPVQAFVGFEYGQANAVAVLSDGEVKVVRQNGEWMAKTSPENVRM